MTEYRITEDARRQWRKFERLFHGSAPRIFVQREVPFARRQRTPAVMTRPQETACRAANSGSDHAAAAAIAIRGKSDIPAQGNALLVLFYGREGGRNMSNLETREALGRSELGHDLGVRVKSWLALLANRPLCRDHSGGRPLPAEPLSTRPRHPQEARRWFCSSASAPRRNRIHHFDAGPGRRRQIVPFADDDARILPVWPRKSASRLSVHPNASLPRRLP